MCKKAAILFLTFLFVFSFISCNKSENNQSNFVSKSKKLPRFYKTATKRKKLTVEKNKDDPYKVICHNEDGTKTAYTFSVPVWKKDFSGFLDYKIDNQLIYEGYEAIVEFPKMDEQEGFILFDEVNASKIAINPSFSLKSSQLKRTQVNNYYGLERDSLEYQSDDKALKKVVTYANTNGFTMDITLNSLSDLKNITFDIICEVDDAALLFENHQTYTSIMSQYRNPFINIKAFYHKNDSFGGYPIIPKLEYADKPGSYKLCFDTELDYPRNRNICFSLSFERYVSSCILDSSIQSEQPDTNMTYSPYALIGKSKFFGEQQLLTRIHPDEIHNLGINNLHDAKVNYYLYNYEKNIQCFRVRDSWCSFETVWNNRVNGIFELSQTNNGSFLSYDYKAIINEMLEKPEEEDNGCIISAKDPKVDKYAHIGTADDYLNAPYLEITYS